MGSTTSTAAVVVVEAGGGGGREAGLNYNTVTCWNKHNTIGHLVKEVVVDLLSGCRG